MIYFIISQSPVKNKVDYKERYEFLANFFGMFASNVLYIFKDCGIIV